MTKWEDTYVMVPVSMPIYWLLVMLPHFAKARVLASQANLADVNKDPRKASEELAKSDNPSAAFISRATGAHLNGWENFSVFLSGIIAATTSGVEHSFVNSCCLVFLVARFFFLVFFLVIREGPASFLRSLCFFVGIGACAAMWVKGIIEV